MGKLFKIIFMTLLAALFVCCGKETPVTPEPEPDPPTPVVTGKPRYVWIDAAANFRFYADDKAYIANDIKRIADCGFTDIIVDVRPTEGTVLFASETAPQARRLATWVGSQYKFVYRTATWDFLQAFIDAGHAQGLKVHASVNTFVGGCGGYYGLDDEGPIFTGDIPTGWATIQNTASGLKSSYYDGVQGTVFLNPANDDVQNYMLTLLSELASYEDLDGIILDRCRFDDSNLMSDFSEQTKVKFKEYIGKDPNPWPVFDKGKERGSQLSYPLSTEQKQWMSFRAKVIHDFIEKAADTVHKVNPDIKFGCYVGAWYSTYYESGVNWASPKYMTNVSYPKWADSDYHNYGYADHCDHMFLGCYASTSSIYGHTEWTMQGFSEQGNRLLMGDTVFAGGPDIGNPEGWPAGGQGSKLYSTIDAIIRTSDGYFVFDLCHIRMYDYWTDMQKAITKYLDSLK